MPINTKATLRTAVAAFLSRTDLNAQIDTFIELGAARLSDELRVPDMETSTTVTLASDWTALPSDFRAVRMIEAEGKTLEYRTPWQLQKLVNAQSQLTTPVYTVQDLQYRVYPVAAGTVVTLLYYAALPELSSDTSTNWLLTRRPDVYLYAALAQARMYLHDDARVMAAQAFVDRYIVEANRAARTIAVGAAPLAVRAA